MRVLVACEYSGVVRDAFLSRGHDAWSCDILPTESPGPHIQGDALAVLGEGWDLLCAHPPCQYLANSGARWLVGNPARLERMREAAAFFRSFYDAPIPRKAIENPIMHCHAREAIGGLRPSQVIQPWMFGHGETKATAFYLVGLPPLIPTDIVTGREARVHRMPPGPDRAKERARTLAGVAAAMAEQWGNPAQARLWA